MQGNRVGRKDIDIIDLECSEVRSILPTFHEFEVEFCFLVLLSHLLVPWTQSDFVPENARVGINNNEIILDGAEEVNIEVIQGIQVPHYASLIPSGTSGRGMQSMCMDSSIANSNRCA